MTDPKNTIETFESQEKAIEYLNKRLAWVRELSCFLHFTPPKHRLIKRAQAEDTFAPIRYKTPGGADRPTFPAWLASPVRREIDRLDFIPDPTLPIGMCEIDGETIYNTYMGPTHHYEAPMVYKRLESLGWTPEKLKEAPLSLICASTNAYLDEVFGHREPDIDIKGYLLDYLAHIVQHPDRLPGSALIFLGAPGCGKTFFGTAIVKPLVHPASFIQVPSRGLTGQWNEHFGSRLVAVADDPYFGRNSDEAMSAMKSLVTESRILYEGKFKPSFPGNNFCRLIVNLNDNTSLRLDPNDRRFTIIRCSTKWLRKGEMFEHLRKSLHGTDAERGAPIHFDPHAPYRQTGSFWLFYHWLKHRDITFSLSDKLPTASGTDYIRQGGNSVYDWLLESHEAAEWCTGTDAGFAWNNEPTKEAKQMVYAWYDRWIHTHEEEKRAVSQKRFFNELRTWLDVRETRVKNEATGEFVRAMVLPARNEVTL